MEIYILLAIIWSLYNVCIYHIYFKYKKWYHYIETFIINLFLFPIALIYAFVKKRLFPEDIKKWLNP